MTAKIINIYGGPGTGKSTTAALVFGYLKLMHIKCELVTEYPKDIIYDDHIQLLKNQTKVFAGQAHRIFRLKDKVDFIITDSPLLLYVNYVKNWEKETLIPHIVKTFNQYFNLNFYLERHTDFQKYGRLETEDQAKQLDKKIIDTLFTYNTPYTILGKSDILYHDMILTELHDCWKFI